MSKADDIRAALNLARSKVGGALNDAVFDGLTEGVSSALKHPRALVNHYARQLWAKEMVAPTAAQRVTGPQTRGPVITVRGVEISKVVKTHMWGMNRDEPAEERNVTVGKHAAPCYFWKGTATFSVGDCSEQAFDAVVAALDKVGETKLLRMLP